MAAIRVPPQVVVGFANARGVPTITRSSGRLSLISIALRGVSPGAVIVMVSRLGAPGKMGLV